MNSDCDVVLHKQCTSALADHCYPATQKKVGAAKSKRPGSSSKCDGEEASSSECHAAHSSTTILGNLDKVSSLCLVQFFFFEVMLVSIFVCDWRNISRQRYHI